MTDDLKMGFHPPLQCARGRTDCRSLAQIIAGDVPPYTFVCCGEVLDGATPEPRDKWAFCFRGCQTRSHCVGTDIRIFVDQRDMSHMVGVLGMGLATVIPPD